MPFFTYYFKLWDRRIPSVTLLKTVLTPKSICSKTNCKSYSSKGAKDVTTTTVSSKAHAPQQGNDIIIYKYDNPRFFKFLNLFAISQLAFWSAISFNSTKLVDAPVKKDESPQSEKKDDLPFWRKWNLGGSTFRNSMVIGSALVGYGIFFVSWMYILRSLRYLILLKDKKTVAFVTYTPFGQNRIMNVPLDCVSAEGSRHSGSSQIPIRVKGKALFYLLDLKGNFPKPTLFDQTVGLNRKF